MCSLAIAISSSIPTAPAYLRLGRNRQARREAYRARFRAALDEAVVDEIRAATNGGFVLGTARFEEQIAAMLGRRVTPGARSGPGRTAAAQRHRQRRAEPSASTARAR